MSNEHWLLVEYLLLASSGSRESLGIFWKPLEFFRILWNPLESFGIFWNLLESFGIFLKYFGIFLFCFVTEVTSQRCRRAPNEEARSIPNWHQLAVFYCTIANLNTVQLVVSTLSRNFPSGISLRSDIGSDPR